MKIAPILIVLLLCFESRGEGIREILGKTIRRLDTIHSFEYVVISQATAAYDTTDYVSKYRSKVTGVRNERDTVIGYDYIVYVNDDNIYLIYDFDFSVTFDWHNKSARVTDFNKYPDRRKSTYAPFYLTAKTMLDFALRGGQADLVVKRDKGDTLVFDILFRRNRYEFRGKNVIKQGRDGFAWSNYRVWLDKKNYLPFRILRKQEHQKSYQEIVRSKINAPSGYRIHALACIPEDFTIREYTKNHKPVDLSGMKAPDFKLPGPENDSLSLSDYYGKVLLLEFTSLGCGPCHLAVPGLIELRNTFDKSQLEILSIEAYLFNTKSEIFKNYVMKKGINYPLLTGNSNITKDYQVPGVPYFLVIDKEGVIRMTIVGFDRATTMTRLKNAITALNE